MTIIPLTTSATENKGLGYNPFKGLNGVLRNCFDINIQLKKKTSSIKKSSATPSGVNYLWMMRAPILIQLAKIKPTAPIKYVKTYDINKNDIENITIK